MRQLAARPLIDKHVGLRESRAHCGRIACTVLGGYHRCRVPLLVPNALSQISDARFDMNENETQGNVAQDAQKGTANRRFRASRTEVLFLFCLAVLFIVVAPLAVLLGFYIFPSITEQQAFGDVANPQWLPQVFSLLLAGFLIAFLAVFYASLKSETFKVLAVQESETATNPQSSPWVRFPWITTSILASLAALGCVFWQRSRSHDPEFEANAWLRFQPNIGQEFSTELIHEAEHQLRQLNNIFVYQSILDAPEESRKLQPISATELRQRVSVTRSSDPGSVRIALRWPIKSDAAETLHLVISHWQDSIATDQTVFYEAQLKQLEGRMSFFADRFKDLTQDKVDFVRRNPDALALFTSFGDVHKGSKVEKAHDELEIRKTSPGNFGLESDLRVLTSELSTYEAKLRDAASAVLDLETSKSEPSFAFASANMPIEIRSVRQGHTSKELFAYSWGLFFAVFAIVAAFWGLGRCAQSAATKHFSGLSWSKVA